MRFVSIGVKPLFANLMSVRSFHRGAPLVMAIAVLIAATCEARAQFSLPFPLPIPGFGKPKKIPQQIAKEVIKEAIRQGAQEAGAYRVARRGGYRVRYSSAASTGTGGAGTAAANANAAAAAARLAQAREQADEIEAARRQDEARDISNAITVFIEDLEYRLKQITEVSNVKAARNLNINQITEAEIRKSVDTAYQAANLQQFEDFESELWTKDRLVVSILQEARKSLKQFFRGVGAKGPSMEDLSRVFQEAAADLHKRAAETMEVLGVGYSYNRLIAAIYEHSDDSTKGFFHAGFAGRFETLEADVMLEPRRQGAAKRNFLAAYRARRQLYDCLSTILPSPEAGAEGAIDASAPPETAGTVRLAAGPSAGNPSGHTSENEARDRSASLDSETTATAEEQLGDEFWLRVKNVVAASCEKRVEHVFWENIEPIASRASVFVSQQTEGALLESSADLK